MRTLLALALIVLAPGFARAQAVGAAPDAAAAASSGASAPGSFVAAAPNNGVYVPPAAVGTTGVYVGPTGREGASRPRRTLNWSLVGSGIGLFAGGWLLTWLSTIVWYAETTSCSGSSWSGSYSCTHVGGPGGWGLGFSFVPVAGPWIMLGDPYLDSAGEILPPILFGLVQDIGLVLLIVGLIDREERAPEPVAAGDWRIGGSAGPSAAFGTLDVVF